MSGRAKVISSTMAMPNANVAMARKNPRSRTAGKPITTASSAAAMPASGMVTRNGMPASIPMALP